MPAPFIAAVFAILGLLAAWSIRRDIIRGTASSQGWTCTLDDNPVGFALIVASKGLMLGFAVAVVLHAFGLVGDPVVAIRHAVLSIFSMTS